MNNIYTKRIAVIVVWAAVQFILFVLKVAGLVSWSWLIILLPLLAPYGVLVFVATAIILYVYISNYLTKLKELKTAKNTRGDII